MIYEEVSRIRSLRDRIKTKLASLGIINSVTPGDPEPESGGTRSSVTLSDCATAVENIGGTQNINTTALVNVATKTGARIDPSVDSVLVANNIKRGVTILGVMGSYPTHDEPDLRHPYHYYGDTEDLSQISPAIYTPPKGYGDIFLYTAERNKTLLPENIRKGVKIMNVIGSYAKDITSECSLAYGISTESVDGYDVKLPKRFPLLNVYAIQYSQMPNISDIQQGSIIAESSINLVAEPQDTGVICYKHDIDGTETYYNLQYNDEPFCRILGIWFGQSKTEYPDNTIKYCKIVTAVRFNFKYTEQPPQEENTTEGFVSLDGINTYTLELPYFPFSIQTEDGQPTSQAMFKIDSNGLAYIKSQIDEQVVVDINNKITDDAKARGYIDSNGNYTRPIFYISFVQFTDRMFWATDWIANLIW